MFIVSTVGLAENGLVMFLWIGINVSHDWLQGVFALQSAAQVDIDKVRRLASGGVCPPVSRSGRH